MFHLRVAGLDTRTTSSSCLACPYGTFGCCVAPPRYGFADIAWVVLSGGREFLLEAIARGHLVPMKDGLAVARIAPDELGPRCTFFDAGCTLPHEHRPTTCNHYVCDRALEDATTTGDGRAARDTARTLERLVPALARLDAALAPEAHGRGHPDIVDASTFDALATRLAALLAEADDGETRDEG